MGVFLLGVMVLCVLLFGARLFVAGDAKALATSLRWVGSIAAAVLALFFLLRGQIIIALVIAGFALWLFTEGRFRPAIFDLFSKFFGGSAGPGSGRGPRPPRRAGPDTMSVAQALEILDIPAGATVEMVKEAHHRLMLKVHPDVGGSDFLAAQINRAKQVLLDDLGGR